MTIRRRLLLALAGLVLISVLAYFLREYVGRYLLTPLLYLLWIARIFYRIIPQSITWSLLLLFFVVLAFSSLRTQRRRRRARPLFLKERETRLETWLSWIAAQPLGSYSRWRLANRLSYLAIEAISQAERLPPEEVRRMIVHSELDLPPEIHRYMLAGLDRMELEPNRGLLARWFPRSRSAGLDLDPARLVDFIETRLET